MENRDFELEKGNLKEENINNNNSSTNVIDSDENIIWYNEYSRKFLEKWYLLEWETLSQRIRFIANRAEEILNKPWFADKFVSYMQKGYYSLSTPIWSNFWLKRGLPISCFGSYIDDNMWDIMFTQWEVGMMSKFGGWASGYFGALRPRGAKIKDNWESSGAVHFMNLFETLVDVVSQGSVRRWHFSPYLPVEHTDIEEFLKIWTEWNTIQKLTHWVTVGSKWLEEMVAGDQDKRKIWAEVIQRRNEMWYPYIMFTDNANEQTVDVYKDKEMKIVASNMCNEIMLPSSPDESFVCDLSSMNLFYYQDWKNTDAVETLTYFLDAVMQDFINKLDDLKNSTENEDRLAYEFMKKAHKFAIRHRAIWIGAVWYHSYLQKNKIAFEDIEAYNINKEIFQLIKEKAYKASQDMAKEYWEPEVLKGYGRRNTTLMAIAPTTSSAFILWQVSQSIEPIWSNCYVKDLAKMKVTIKNKELEALLEEKWQNTKEVWDSIRNNDGSVQHLDFLTKQEKNIFKTFSEINQYAVIDQAADRQKFIDQGQSLNLMINPSTPTKEINALYLEAWKQGIKWLYYQHSKSAAQELSRKIVCSWCEA